MWEPLINPPLPPCFFFLVNEVILYKKYMNRSVYMPSFSIKHFFWRGDKPHPSHDFHLPHSNSTQLGRAHRSTSSFVHQFSSFHRFLHRIFPDILSLRGLGWSKHSGNMELGFVNCLQKEEAEEERTREREIERDREENERSWSIEKKDEKR